MPLRELVLQIPQKEPPRGWSLRGRDHRRVTSSGIWQSSASHGCCDVAALLDLPEIAALIDETDAAGDRRGRKGYGARALVGACLVNSLFGLPTWTFVAALIAEHPGLQDALGGCPSVWAMYRFCEQAANEQPDLEPAWTRSRRRSESGTRILAVT